ncbi:hypothetical protein [Nesterenkonia alkaliphila]|uniref:Lipoprotein n=1 Tax=Nesterenkonia alkaliphila TaxID=1463631 RepID=A0A7K1ULE0_9MICC|nr:hypothetical protein [Nesterenkonia alkaliphila]MVT27283.1 hypothetical protein [Nesterenkonia alkaliphila]
MARWAAPAAISLAVLGCAQAAQSTEPTPPRSGPPAQLSSMPDTVEGPSARSYGTLRAMQIRRLLLDEQELFPRTSGEVLEYAEAVTVLHRWRHTLVPEAEIPDDDAASTACAQALGEVYTVTQQSPLNALMLVHAEQPTGGKLPAEVAVGIASYRQPAQVQLQWEMAAQVCDGAMLSLGEQQYRLSALEYAGASGLSFSSDSAEQHVLSLDNGHNSITVYTQTSAEHAAALLERQLAKFATTP